MGNTIPREAHMGSNLKCIKCYKVLPPCHSFSNLYKTTLHGRYVYVFNGGAYYRPASTNNYLYECAYCFNKPIRDQENMRREEQERRREEERRRQEEQRKREELAQRLEESEEQAQDQHEEQVSEIIEEHETKQHVQIAHLDEFEGGYESGSGRDELLEALSSKCSIPVSNFNFNQLTSSQLSDILSALDKLLFDEWIPAPPSLSTLQHTQVFITELCALSLDMSEDLTLESISNQLQSLVGSISRSACDVPENFLLTQALYLNLMHFFTDHRGSDTDAIFIATQWAGQQLTPVDHFFIDFLGTLMSSLQNIVGRASVFILKTEVQCLRLLLFALSHLNDKASHSKSTDVLLILVQSSHWTPAEALALFKVLLEKFTEDAAIIEVLEQVHVYKISPEWVDDYGRSLIQFIVSSHTEEFKADFYKTLRMQNERNLELVLAELEQMKTLDYSVIHMMKTITTGVLRYSESAPKEAPFMKDSFKRANLNVDDLQACLSQLCKAVYDTKGWWPTVRQMLRWCALMLTERTEVPELVGLQEDPCVIAMFAATKVCMGKKLDLMLTSDTQTATEEWSDFYNRLGISLKKNSNTSQMEVYEADIVYGTLDYFVSDYFQCGSQATSTGTPHPRRGFIIEERSLCDLNIKLLKLKENNVLAFAVEMQSLMGNLQTEDITVRHSFIKALFQVLHSHTNKSTGAGGNILSSLQKLTGKKLKSNEVYILTFLEKLIGVLTDGAGARANNPFHVGRYCLEILFACALQFHTPKEQIKEIFQMLSNLTLWSPVEILNLFVALTDHHHNNDCISILKILHLMETYQVSPNWRDKRNQSLLELMDPSSDSNLLQHLRESFGEEKEKDIETLFDEIRQMKNIDEKILQKSHSMVSYVTNLIASHEIENYTDTKLTRDLSKSMETEDLQKILAVLCQAVHLKKAKKKWWPRATQMASWCLLTLSDHGKLLEMGTGEGKSCVIAMFAVLRALRGEKVDVVSSSSVLCQRDAVEWADFYSYFDITVDTNTNKTEDEDRKICYQKDVVYGTIEAFAADHLRQIFEMKDVRPDRGFQCILIDEVDSLLLDQGVQLTYLSSPMVSMQHLNPLLAMIWSHVSQYGFLSTGYETLIRALPVPFFKAIFDSINTEGTEIDDALDILHIAEVTKTVPEGFTEEIFKSERDELFGKLKTVSQDAVVNFFQDMEDYVPYGFNVYTLDDKGLLCLRKASPYSNKDIPQLAFLVLKDGLCCPLYESEEILFEPITKLLSEKIQYTPCTENSKDKISFPGFLRNLIEKKMSTWVQNAFLAMMLREGREYVVEHDSVCPVDFRSTGIVELNKKWGDGLQQFVEFKHQIKLSTISVVTNYVSNVSFFEKYNGKIYGTTGTLGSETDMLFLQELYPNLSACKMPSFNRKKLYEVKGTLKTSVEEWKSEIIQVVMAQICPTSYRKARAALVICETINTANEIHDELKDVIPGKIILYCRSDKNSLSVIDKELLPGDVIVATNLAGRGTDIKVSKEVNNSGGLFVVLSFLSDNSRVERQSFGRTARKGKPGSAMVVMTTTHLQEAFRTVSSLEEAKKTRDRHAAEKINDMTNDVTEMKLREDLFSEYCKTLRNIYRHTDIDERRAIVAIMNEFWGIWLQTKTEEIEQLKRYDLENSLRTDLSQAEKQCQSQTSPCSSIYHYIKFGNNALEDKKWDVSARLYERAMALDENWAAIAFYSHSYCTIKKEKGDYLTKARDELLKAQKSLKYLSEECIICLKLVKMTSAKSDNSEPTSLEKQLTARCNMYSYFDDNISKAIGKLEEIKARGGDAIAKKSPVFSLVKGEDNDLEVEAYNLYDRGLIYVFAVEEKPPSIWNAVLLFLLGIMQIIAGTLLVVFTCGSLAQVGLGLISEGISDCIYSIKAMVTGVFSWIDWAIQKAISIGVSLIACGVGKLIAEGIKGTKTLVKMFGKELTSMPKFLSKQAKEGFSAVLRTNMKNAAKHVAKKVVEELVIYGLGVAEEAILNEIMNGIKNEVKNGILGKVKPTMETDPLAALTDSIVLSHLEEKKQLPQLLQDDQNKKKLLGIFTKLSKAALHSFTSDLDWQKQLNSSIITVIDSAKSAAGKDSKTRVILTTIQVVHMSTLATDAIATAVGLSDRFFLNLQDELKIFKKNKSLTEKVMQNELSASDIEILKGFRQDVANTISPLLASALVDVFHQKFSTHLVSHAQDKLHGAIRTQVKSGLKSEQTEDELKAGQNNRYLSYMSGDLNISGGSDKLSKSYAEKIKNPKTAGGLLDIRILSETTGTKVLVLTQDRHGKLTQMQELNPSSKPARRTVTLVYTPKSTKNPDSRYDVRIKNQTVSVTGKGCLFHALAKGMMPGASEEDISKQAERLRSMEAEALLRNPHQWGPFVERKNWINGIRGGDWYMAEGPAPAKARADKIKGTEQVFEQDIGQVKRYREWQGETTVSTEKDHQPPVKVLMEAKGLNKNSQLATAMLEVSVNTSLENVHGYPTPGLPTVYVPEEVYREFSNTKTKQVIQKLLAETISKDDVAGTFKLTILGAMPTFILYNKFQREDLSSTRLETFRRNYADCSKELVNSWSSLLGHRHDLMWQGNIQDIQNWIYIRAYEDPNDSYRNQVLSNLK